MSVCRFMFRKNKCQYAMIAISVLNKTNICQCASFVHREKYIQSTLAISKSKGPSKTLRDIRSSTYQICSIEVKTIRTTKFHK